MAHRKTKKRSSRKNAFKRLQNTPKMRSIRKKIRDHKSKGKKLSREYQRALKSESRRLK